MKKKTEAKQLWAAAWYAAAMVLRLKPKLFAVGFFDELFSRTLPFAEAWLAAAVITALPKLADVAARATVVQHIAWFLAVLLVLRIARQTEASLYDLYRSREELELDAVVRRRLTHKFADLPYARYEDKRVMDQYQLAEKYGNEISTFVLFRLREVLGTAYTVVLGTLAVLHVSLLLAVVLAAAALPQLWLELRVNREQRRQWRESTPVRRLAEAYQDLFRPLKIKDIRLFGLVQYALDKALHYGKASQLEQVKLDRAAEKYRLALRCLDATVEVGTLAYIVRLIYLGLQPVGQFVFLQQVIQQFSAALSSLVWTAQGLDEYLAGSTEFKAFMSLPDRSKGLPLADAYRPVRYESVSFTYPGADRPSLHNVSFTIQPGQTVAFVGENGAGKTTLVKLLMKLYEPTAGAVYIGDEDLQTVDEDAWHDRLGVLFQDFMELTDFTVRDNIRLGRIGGNPDDQEVIAALKKAGAYDFVQQLPKGLDTYLGTYMDEENGTFLSGGQSQRLAIARVLYRDPEILILDEPTSAVDARAEYEIFNELDKARQGKTTILISHRFSTVRKADYIYVLHKGRIVEQGSHQELLALDGHYAGLFNAQAEGYR